MSVGIVLFSFIKKFQGKPRPILKPLQYVLLSSNENLKNKSYQTSDKVLSIVCDKNIEFDTLNFSCFYSINLIAKDNHYPNTVIHTKDIDGDAMRLLFTDEDSKSFWNVIYDANHTSMMYPYRSVDHYLSDGLMIFSCSKIVTTDRIFCALTHNWRWNKLFNN